MYTQSFGLDKLCMSQVFVQNSCMFTGNLCGKPNSKEQAKKQPMEQTCQSISVATWEASKLLCK